MKAKLTAAVLGLAMLGVAAVAIAHDSDRFHASLDGYQAVPLALSLPGSSARARLRVYGNSSIDYQVEYKINTTDIAPAANGGIVGTVTQIHLHFGRPGVAGGVIAFLCSNLNNGPAGTPLCPNNISGNISSGSVPWTTLTTASIAGLTGQSIATGGIDEAIAAIRAETTYVCVHTTGFPGGSIRGAVEDED